MLQPTLNEFPCAPEGSKQDTRCMCRFSAIQAHRPTVRPSFQVQSGCGTLCQQTFASYLLTVSRPISAVSVSSEHRTTSCGLRPVFIACTALFFYWKLLFIVCCTAFSIHILLFTPGAILLGIESAPLSEDEDEDIKLWFWLAVIIIHSPGFSAAVCRLSREAARIYQKRWTFLIVN